MKKYIALVLVAVLVLGILQDVVTRATKRQDHRQMRKPLSR